MWLAVVIGWYVSLANLTIDLLLTPLKTNANLVGCVDLSHSLSHALPPPGYNKQRPHCMVLTLSNGGVYFFQAGTEELVNEWVSTCNYWAARTSKEPLAGGVSNMEYGWNRVLEPSHGRSVSDNDPAAQQDYSDAMSVRSGRSTRSRFGWKEGSNTVRAASSPYVDRIFINDWKPPMPPTVSSLHDEETQLEALWKHVASMKADLQKHNELREPMAALVGCCLARSHTRCSRPFPLVSTSQCERYEIIKQLGEKIPVFIEGDRQVRFLYRLSSGGHVSPTEEKRGERFVVANPFSHFKWFIFVFSVGTGFEWGQRQ